MLTIGPRFQTSSTQTAVGSATVSFPPVINCRSESKDVIKGCRQRQTACMAAVGGCLSGVCKCNEQWKAYSSSPTLNHLLSAYAKHDRSAQEGCLWHAPTQPNCSQVTIVCRLGRLYRSKKASIQKINIPQPAACSTFIHDSNARNAICAHPALSLQVLQDFWNAQRSCADQQGAARLGSYHSNAQ